MQTPMKKNSILVSILSFSIFGCNGSDSGISVTPEATDTATYEMTFSTSWTRDNFPTNYPDNRHFSGLIGVNHTSDAQLFELGEMSSNGIISVAESGSKVELSSEIESLQNLGHAESIIDGQGISANVDKVVVTFSVSQDFPLISIVSMVAPSPDWFVGIDSLPLFLNGNWIENKELQLYVMDAGSDSGNIFTAANLASNPVESITLLSTSRSDTDFEKGIHFSTAKTIGKFTFKRIE